MKYRNLYGIFVQCGLFSDQFRLENICRTKTTAQRLAKNKKQHIDNKIEIRQIRAITINDIDYVPEAYVTILEPTNEDLREEARMEKRNKILNKIRALGLSEEEIEVLAC